MIDILMATYNGEKYITEQIDSIINQSYSDWQLIISDDCSSDNTVNIIKKYQSEYPDKIFLHENAIRSGSAKANFYRLLSYIDNDYVMFADQDDVWLPEKISITLAMMQTYEKIYGSHNPVLVHTDLYVVDGVLNMVYDSLFDMQNMNYTRNNFNNILVQNIVTGCTVMINKALVRHLFEIPVKSVMHDMWLALVAAAFGKVVFLNHPTILYRQHGNNAEGAKNVKSFEYILYKLFSVGKIHENLLLNYAQAGEFLRIYGDFLNPALKNMLYEYSNFSQKSILEKYKIIKKYGLEKQGLVRLIVQLIG